MWSSLKRRFCLPPVREVNWAQCFQNWLRVTCPDAHIALPWNGLVTLFSVLANKMKVVAVSVSLNCFEDLIIWCFYVQTPTCHLLYSVKPIRTGEVLSIICGFFSRDITMFSDGCVHPCTHRPEVNPKGLFSHCPCFIVVVVVSLRWGGGGGCLSLTGPRALWLGWADWLVSSRESSCLCFSVSLRTRIVCVHRNAMLFCRHKANLGSVHSTDLTHWCISSTPILELLSH